MNKKEFEDVYQKTIAIAAALIASGFDYDENDLAEKSFSIVAGVDQYLADLIDVEEDTKPDGAIERLVQISKKNADYLDKIAAGSDPFFDEILSDPFCDEILKDCKPDGETYLELIERIQKLAQMSPRTAALKIHKMIKIGKLRKGMAGKYFKRND
jgi:hypothetical protein